MGPRAPAVRRDAAADSRRREQPAAVLRAGVGLDARLRRRRGGTALAVGARGSADGPRRLRDRATRCGRRCARRPRGGRARRRQPAAGVVLAGGAQLRARDAAERGRAAAVPARARRPARPLPRRLGARRRARARDPLLRRVRAGAAGAVAAAGGIRTAAVRSPPSPRSPPPGSRCCRCCSRRRAIRTTSPARRSRCGSRSSRSSSCSAIAARSRCRSGCSARCWWRAARGCCCVARRRTHARRAPAARCDRRRRGRAAAARRARRRRLPQHAQPAAGADPAAGGARGRLRRERRAARRPARCSAALCALSLAIVVVGRSRRAVPAPGLEGARATRSASATPRVRSSSRLRTASWRCATTARASARWSPEGADVREVDVVAVAGSPRSRQGAGAAAAGRHRARRARLRRGERTSDHDVRDPALPARAAARPCRSTRIRSARCASGSRSRRSTCCPRATEPAQRGSFATAALSFAGSRSGGPWPKQTSAGSSAAMRRADSRLQRGVGREGGPIGARIGAAQQERVVAPHHVAADAACGPTRASRRRGRGSGPASPAR